ncbi:hypothetical protein [Flavobacterium sp. SM2513]|uniref:hypothetical protein n=1 Tax=Flavobacterium sp. SM2513 TaxID=3424766 RepID=UPI003D7F59FA
MKQLIYLFEIVNSNLQGYLSDVIGNVISFLHPISLTFETLGKIFRFRTCF